MVVAAGLFRPLFRPTWKAVFFRQVSGSGAVRSMLAGMPRGTFVGGEGSRFFHGDRWGRSFYLPPNSASSTMFLPTLRDLLV